MSDKMHKVEIIVTKELPNIDDFGTVEELNKMRVEYPKVYYTFEAMGESAGFGSYPGRNDQNFDVHEHAANVMLMVKQSLMRHFEEKTLMSKLAQEALDMMDKAIKREA